MCGIAGFNWADENLIQRMTQKIHHRGPDAQGTRVFDAFSFGNTRLSILDLSSNGNQPMSTRNGTLWIVYNGEVYNFPELKKELLQKGHVFKSNTDTEVVLKCYEEYGLNALSKLNGIFGFAIWDDVKKELLLARDRIGVKPLYYYWNQGRLIFGSEIKSILEAPQVHKEINRQALYHYVGYEFVPAPDTMFQHIQKLPPGHYARLKNGEFQITSYWDLEFRIQEDDEDSLANKVFVSLGAAVKRQMIADVPVGVFLSGGLDSSAVVGFAAQNTSKKLKTFSIGYHDKTFSELPYAQQVADFFGTEHHVLMIDPISPEDIEHSLYHLDEPMTDLSTIPFHLICKKAKEHVKVCLSGEGGDEMFMGYDRFKAAKLNRMYSLLPESFRKRILNPFILSLPDQSQKKGVINMLKRFIEGSLYPEEVGAMRWQYFLNPEKEKNLFHPQIHSQICFDPFRPLLNSKRRSHAKDPIDADIYIDTRFTMTDSVLMKVDKMSMATSLEVRVPFLDNEVMDLCASIPHRLKLKGFKTKYIFRKALEMHRFLPPNIISRGKQGYSLPIKNWLREELRSFTEHLLQTSPILLENFNPSTLKTLFHEHMSHTHNHNHLLWALIHLALWHKKFFCHSPVSE